MKAILITTLFFLSFISNGQSVEALLNSGKEKYELKNYAGAKKDLDQAIEMKTTIAEVYLIRGNVNLKQGNSKAAMDDYSKAIELTPSARAYHNRAILKKNMKDYAGAKEDCTKAIALDPKYLYAYNTRALLLYVEGDLKNAIKDFDMLITLDPNDALSYTFRGIAKGRVSDPKGGISDLSKAITLDSGNAHNYYNRAYLKMDLEQYKEAITDLDMAIKLDASYTDAYFERANAYYELKDHVAAIRDYTKSIDLAPQAKAYYFRGREKMNTKDDKGACADFNEAVKGGYKIKDKAIIAFIKVCSSGRTIIVTD